MHAIVAPSHLRLRVSHLRSSTNAAAAAFIALLKATSTTGTFVATRHSSISRATTKGSTARFLGPSLSFVPAVRTTTTMSATATDATTNPFKRVKKSDDDAVPPSSKVIGTHSGTFQADEALGVWFLRQLPAYRNSRVVRSRDADDLSKADIVIDVGGTYDHSALRYDHHQRDFDEYFYPSEEHEKRVTRLSACGLIFFHYGMDVISSFYPNLSEEQLELAYGKMYGSFVEAIDAIDNGVEVAPEVKYRDSTGLSARVSRLNPRWNEEEGTDGVSPDERFEVASALCGADFVSVLEQVVESHIPAVEYVERAVLARKDVDESGQVIKLDGGGMPWKSILYEMEKKHGVDPEIKFVLYTDQAGMWRVQAVPVEGKGFTNRLGLPESWRGVRDADLTEIAGIPGCTFCHKSGFIGGNETYEGALAMARAALAEASKG